MLNGLTRGELNRRARPLPKPIDHVGEDATTANWLSFDPEEQPRRLPDTASAADQQAEEEFVSLLRSTRTFTGWVADGEDVLDVICESKSILEQLGVTRHAVAACLRAFIGLCEEKPLESSRFRRGHAVSGVRCVVGESPHAVAGVAAASGDVDALCQELNKPPFTVAAAAAAAGEEGPLYSVQHLITGGFQHSLFCNFEQDTVEDAWNDEFLITCSGVPGLTLLVAGNAEHGIIQLIEKYGFFEGGGTSNPFRIDPAIVVAFAAGAHTTRSRAIALDLARERLRDLRSRQRLTSELFQRTSVRHADIQQQARVAEKLLNDYRSSTMLGVPSTASKDELEDASVIVTDADACECTMVEAKRDLEELQEDLSVQQRLLRQLDNFEISTKPT